MPLTALMVVYTFVGLSITAEPIVESRVAAEPTAVATEFVAIPADAVLPDAQSGNLLPVGPGKSARTKLTYKVLGSAFHDGTKTGAADLLYAYAFAYRWGSPAERRARSLRPLDRRCDRAPAPASRGRARDRRRRGLEILPRRRRQFRARGLHRRGLSGGCAGRSRMERGPGAALEHRFLGTVLVLDGGGGDARLGRILAGRGDAARRPVARPRSLGRDERQAGTRCWRNSSAKRSGRRRCARYVSEEEARRRWQALAAFYKASGHFLVTNGPYRLKSWTPQSIALEAFRDLTYPLGVGSYDAYAIPRRGFITEVDWNGERLTVTGDIEVVEKFQRSYRLVRMPLSSVPATDLKRAAPECRYVVTDSNGRVAARRRCAARRRRQFPDRPDRPSGRPAATRCRRSLPSTAT